MGHTTRLKDKRTLYISNKNYKSKGKLLYILREKHPRETSSSR